MANDGTWIYLRKDFLDYGDACSSKEEKLAYYEGFLKTAYNGEAEKTDSETLNILFRLVDDILRRDRNEVYICNDCPIDG